MKFTLRQALILEQEYHLLDQRSRMFLVCLARFMNQ
jgi:hypothetical protein